MWSVFKGWRRKLGVMTLVMACVFMLEWVRGLSVIDVFRYRLTNRTTLSLYSIRHSILFEMECFDDDSPRFYPPLWAILPDDLNPLKIFPIEWSQRILSFGFGRFRGKVDSLGHDSNYNLQSISYPFFSTYCNVPCWSIVIPLTVISLWLLLTKPDKSIQKKIILPITEKMA
jgi:hypothetical protein